MKWVVIWVVINYSIIPCNNNFNRDWVDEYGQKHESIIQSLETCYEFNSTRMGKYFDSHEDAIDFIKKAKKECEHCSNFELKSITDKDIDGDENDYR